MKAAVFQGLGCPLTVDEVPVPRPGAGEVLIEVARCGVCSSDIQSTEDPLFGVRPGAILGHEYCGTVLEVGAGVTRVRAGSRVAVIPLCACDRCGACAEGLPAHCAEVRLTSGGYAQFSVVKESQSLALPGTVSLDDGALVEPLAVALHGVMLSGLRPGARVLVIGAGPIGLGATFWARRMGATRVLQTAGSTRCAELALTMGATAFIERNRLTREAFVAALGGEPDIVFECTGKPGVAKESLEYVRPRGTVVLLGLCTAPDQLIAAMVVGKEIRIQGSAFFTRREFEQAADVLDGGCAPPRAMVTDTIMLAELPQRFEALRKHSRSCKVHVLTRP